MKRYGKQHLKIFIVQLSFLGEKVGVNCRKYKRYYYLFTGSTKTGRKIEKLPTNKLYVLEMGGNNALIVEDNFNSYFKYH